MTAERRLLTSALLRAKVQVGGGGGGGGRGDGRLWHRDESAHDNGLDYEDLEADPQTYK